jgi:hypothetical protein
MHWPSLLGPWMLNLGRRASGDCGGLFGVLGLSITGGVSL